MNRRKFLSLLGIGTAVVAVAPSALSMMESADVAAPAAYSTYIVGKDSRLCTPPTETVGLVSRDHSSGGWEDVVQ